MGQEKVLEPNWSLAKGRIFVTASEVGKKLDSDLYISDHYYS